MVITSPLIIITTSASMGIEVNVPVNEPTIAGIAVRYPMNENNIPPNTANVPKNAVIALGGLSCPVDWLDDVGDIPKAPKLED